MAGLHSLMGARPGAVLHWDSCSRSHVQAAVTVSFTGVTDRQRDRESRQLNSLFHFHT